MRIMAIDYGDAHTGIAISDPTGLLAGFTTTINAYRPELVVEHYGSGAGTRRRRAGAGPSPEHGRHAGSQG